ncbi:hypothetical protein M5E87_14995 [Flavonifractor plautii]|nr:hypothetical protein M5E87_14995 [Flavonifractor plautii]
MEGAEDALFRLGYTDFRVRVFHGAARLQLPAGQLERAIRERAALRAALAPISSRFCWIWRSAEWNRERSRPCWSRWPPDRWRWTTPSSS